MNNQKFIDTLRLCGKLEDLTKDTEDVLVKSSVNLKEYYLEVEKYFKKEKINELKILENLSHVVKKHDINIDDYKKFLKTYAITFDNRIDMIDDLESHYILLMEGFKAWKIQSIDSMRVCLNGKKQYLTDHYNDNFKVFYIGGKETNYGAFFIKDGKTEGFKLSNFRDEVALVRKIIKTNDYDLVLIPDFTLGEFEILNTYGISNITNKEYLDLHYILGDSQFDDSCEYLLKYYNHLRNSKYNICRFYQSMIRCTGVGYFDKISLISVFVSYLENIKDTNKRKKYEEKIFDIIKYKSEYIVYNGEDTSILNIRHLVNTNTKMQLEDVIETYKKVNIADIGNFKAKINGKELVFRVKFDNNGYRIENEHKVYRDCFVIIDNQYNMNIVHDKNTKVDDYLVLIDV